MPKRGGRTRGGSRGGGRGGSRGGSRGGGSFSSFNLSKSSKRRASKNKAAAHNTQDTPELMDLGGSEYLPEIGRTMNALSKRPNRRMLDEARYTDRHLADTMNQPLRRQPIEFVKASEDYNPKKELLEQLKNYDGSADLSVDMEKLNVQPDLPGATESETSLVSSKMESNMKSLSDSNPTSIMDEGAMVEDTIPSVTACDTPLETAMPDLRSEQIEFDAQNIIQTRSSNSSVILPVDLTSSSSTHVEPENGTPSLTDKIMDDTIVEENEDTPASPSYEEVDQNEGSDDQEEELVETANIEDFFTIDETGDDEFSEKHGIAKKSTASLLHEGRSKVNASHTSSTSRAIPRNSSHAHSAIEHDPYFSVGKVLLKTSTDSFGNVTTKLPRSGKQSKGFVSLSNTKNSFYEEESLDDDDLGDDDDDDDAAFEDYKSQILANFNSDGESEDGDINENFADLDDDNKQEYGNYGDYVSGKPQLGDYSDIYISSDEFDDLSSDDNDDKYLNSEEEGLEDILAFARTQQKVQKDLDPLPTQTIGKKGRGKKQKLELGSHLELELRESLMEQFHYQKQSKREKKIRKKEKRQREGVELHDLNIKYDYSLHIQEIKQEFEIFLHDVSRESMSFPPLDGHGNKTLHKLANHYNMKCIRCGGNGLSLFMKIAKTKKTFRYIPAYDQIGYIMKQRPVFRRVDVKPRTQEEVAESGGKKERQGPKSDAVVREGDIVGGQAPEIGRNNIGRQLLVKLGWVKGEGLGALGNKGISEPLTATVKRSKTGLK